MSTPDSDISAIQPEETNQLETPVTPESLAELEKKVMAYEQAKIEAIQTESQDALPNVDTLKARVQNIGYEPDQALKAYGVDTQLSAEAAQINQLCDETMHTMQEHSQWK